MLDQLESIRILGLGPFEFGLLLITASLCSVIIYFLFVRLLTSRNPIFDPKYLSTFFDLDELISDNRRFQVRMLIGLPFSLLVLISSVYSHNLVHSVSLAFIDHGARILEFNDADQLNEIKRYIPDYLSPIIVLFFVTVFFLPKINIVFTSFRDMLIFAFDIDRKIQAQAMGASRLTLSAYTFDEAKNLLNERFRVQPPVPAQLSQAGSREDYILAYQLLFFSIPEIRKAGPSRALNDTLKRIDVHARIPEPGTTQLEKVFAGVTLYVVLSLLYVVFVPIVGGKMSVMLGFTDLVRLPKSHIGLLLLITQYSLSTVIPLAVGVYIYYARRIIRRSKENWRTSFVVVFCIQFIMSLVTNLTIGVINVLQSRFGNMNGSLSLYDDRFFVDIFLPSIIPGSLLLIFLIFPSLRKSLSKSAAIALAAGILFWICQYTYESMPVPTDSVGPPLNFYWHQFMFGFYITFIYLLCRNTTHSMGAGLFKKVRTGAAVSA